MGHISPRQQYEEVELTYRETRNWLGEIERKGKHSPEARRLKALRLLALRAARDSLYRIALAEPDGSSLVPPADHERSA